MADAVLSVRRAVGMVLLLGAVHAAQGADVVVKQIQASFTSPPVALISSTSLATIRPPATVTPTPSLGVPGIVVTRMHTSMTSPPVALISPTSLATMRPPATVTPTPSPGVPGTPKPRPNSPDESSKEGSLPVAAYVAMGGGGVGFLVVLVTGFCLWIKCKRSGMKRKLRKNIKAKSVVTWGTPSTVSTHYQSQASEQTMDWKRHAKARSSDVDSAIEMGSVATGLTHSPSTLISPDDSVSQVLHDKNTGVGACRERQKLMQLLKQKIREKPHLEAQIINIPESLYENRRDFPKDHRKRIEDVLECFSTDTLIQTLHEINQQ